MAKPKAQPGHEWKVLPMQALSSSAFPTPTQPSSSAFPAPAKPSPAPASPAQPWPTAAEGWLGEPYVLSACTIIPMACCSISGRPCSCMALGCRLVHAYVCPGFD